MTMTVAMETNAGIAAGTGVSPLEMLADAGKEGETEAAVRGAEGLRGSWHETLAQLGMKTPDGEEPWIESPVSGTVGEADSGQEIAQPRMAIVPQCAIQARASGAKTVWPQASPGGSSGRAAGMQFPGKDAAKSIAEMAGETKLRAVAKSNFRPRSWASRGDSPAAAAKTNDDQATPGIALAVTAFSATASTMLPVGAPAGVPGAALPATTSGKKSGRAEMAAGERLSTATSSGEKPADRDAGKWCSVEEDSGARGENGASLYPAISQLSAESGKLEGAGGAGPGQTQNAEHWPEQDAAANNAQAHKAETVNRAGNASHAAPGAGLAAPSAADASKQTAAMAGRGAHTAATLQTLNPAADSTGHGKHVSEAKGEIAAIENSSFARDPSGWPQRAGATLSREAPASAGTSVATEQETFAALDTDTNGGAPAWIHTAPHQAEAGFQDPALGWVGVRADVTGGAIHAAVVPGSADAAQALSGHMAGLSAHLAVQHPAVHSVTVAAPEANGAHQGAGQGAQQGYQGSRESGGQTAGRPGEPQNDPVRGGLAAGSTESATLAARAPAGATIGLPGGEYISVLA